MLGWVTVFGLVNHFVAEPGTQVYSAWARRLWVSCNEYPAKAGEVNRLIAWYTSQYPWSCSVLLMPGWGLASGDQRRRTESGSALEACSRWCVIQIHIYYTLLYFGSVVKKSSAKIFASFFSAGDCYVERDEEIAIFDQYLALSWKRSYKTAIVTMEDEYAIYPVVQFPKILIDPSRSRHFLTSNNRKCYKG